MLEKTKTDCKTANNPNNATKTMKLVMEQKNGQQNRTCIFKKEDKPAVWAILRKALLRGEKNRVNKVCNLIKIHVANASEICSTRVIEKTSFRIFESAKLEFYYFTFWNQNVKIQNSQTPSTDDTYVNVGNIG